MVNGSEDEEELCRLSPPQADAYYLEQAFLLERLRREADRLRARLQGLVETLRCDGPEILVVWADAHGRVCCSLLHSLPDKSDEDKTARFVAKETLTAWKKLPEGGETFIGIPTPWLEGYLELLKKELEIQGQSS